MRHACCGIVLLLCCTAARGQVLIYPALAQPPGMSAYPQAFPQSFYQQPFYGGGSPYGFGGYGPGSLGIGGYGLGGYGGFGGIGGYGYGGYGFGARGYYPPNPFGNMNWLPPNPPSPYLVAPSGRQYLEQTRQRDQAAYTDLILLHRLDRLGQ